MLVVLASSAHRVVSSNMTVLLGQRAPEALETISMSYALMVHIQIPQQHAPFAMSITTALLVRLILSNVQLERKEPVARENQTDLKAAYSALAQRSAPDTVLMALSQITQSPQEADTSSEKAPLLSNKSPALGDFTTQIQEAMSLRCVMANTPSQTAAWLDSATHAQMEKLACLEPVTHLIVVEQSLSIASQATHARLTSTSSEDWALCTHDTSLALRGPTTLRQV